MDFTNFPPYEIDRCEFSKIFKKALEQNGLVGFYSEALEEKLYRFSKIFLSTNQVHNLTAIRDIQGVVYKHYADSILALDALGGISASGNVIDIGCGGGFPSVPLSAANESLTVLGIDSTSKKVDFVDSAAKESGIMNLSAMVFRAEMLGHEKQFREKFDFATARAVAAMSILSELCLPFVKLGGMFVALKGKDGKEETALAKPIIEELGGKIKEIREYSLTLPDGTCEGRTLILIQKVRNMPNKFPRSYSAIANKKISR